MPRSIIPVDEVKIKIAGQRWMGNYLSFEVIFTQLEERTAVYEGG